MKSGNKGTMKKSKRNHLAMLLHLVCYQDDFNLAEDLPRSNSYGTESRANEDGYIETPRMLCFCLCVSGRRYQLS